ncbi:MAG: glycosyltransferase [Synechococcus sp.]|nr:glycosyltransferase [Synechococcus sp.]
MELLLIHQSYPAQFRYLAPALQQLGWQVRGLGAAPPSHAQGRRGAEAAAVERLNYGWQPPELPEDLVDPAVETALRRAGAIATCCQDLCEQGYTPDVILIHSGWGDALYLREIWPRSILVIYPELYASPLLNGFGFDSDLSTPSFALRARWRRRNLMNLAAIADADAAVVPTHFQLTTFPPHLRSRFHVIHEGVDLQQVGPHPLRKLQIRPGLVLSKGDPIVSFVSRSLEPLRGFRTFMRALPSLMQRFPALQVVVVGDASPGYGQPSAHPDGYRGEMLALLGAQLPLERLHFLGHVPHHHLLGLFQITSAHVHLSYPYALSWSLLEAMACGAVVVGSANPPISDVIQHGHNGLLVPFNDPEALTGWLTAILEQPSHFHPLGHAARATVEQRFGLEAAASAYHALLRSLLQVPSRPSAP